MSSALPRETEIDWSRPVRMTVEQYEALEERSEEKHEYYDGIVRPLSRLIAMAGGTEQHSLTIGNSIRELGNALKGHGCRVYDSNLQVKVRGTEKRSYPDVSVVCGEPEFDPDVSKRRAINNPLIVIEVLSESTEVFDRSDKLRYYRLLESFREYVLIDPRRVDVLTLFLTDEGTWVTTFYQSINDKLVLQSTGVSIPLTEIYRDVELEDATDD